MASSATQTSTPELLAFIESAYLNKTTVKHQIDNNQRKMDSFLSTTITDQPTNGRLHNSSTTGETHKSYIPAMTMTSSPVAPTNSSTPVASNGIQAINTTQETPMAQSDATKKRRTKSPLTMMFDDDNDDGTDGVGSLVECMSSMKTDIGDQIQKGNAHTTKLLEALRKEVGDIHTVLDRQDKSIDALQKENTFLHKRNMINEGRITRLEKQAHDTHEEVLHIQQRSMSNNLVIQNIPESTQEIVKNTLADFMSRDLKMTPQQINRVQIIRAHRIGTRGSYPRSIVVKLNDEGKSLILSHTKNLKGSTISVFVQMPRELAERKKQLVTKFKEAKSKNITTKWLGEKLQIGSNIHQIKKDMVHDINIDVTQKATEIKVGRTPPITHDGDSFQASGIRIQSRDDVLPGLHAIYADTRVARATHNIYAYRIVTPGSKIEHYEDDGEFGAGRRIMNLLIDNNINNTLVCVTRWYGGKHLGPARFDKITQCAKTVLGI